VASIGGGDEVLSEFEAAKTWEQFDTILKLNLHTRAPAKLALSEKWTGCSW
jgi:hypothetical protein